MLDNLSFSSDGCNGPEAFISRCDEAIDWLSTIVRRRNEI